MLSDATDYPSLEDLRFLFIENGDSSEQRSDQRKRSWRLLVTNPVISIHYLWRKFDDKFMRPVFGGRGFVPFVPGSPTSAAEEGQENS